MLILTEKQCKTFLDLAVKRTANYLRENQLRGVSLGISGGVDSAVVSLIGLKAIENLKKSNYEANYEYFFLDCDSDDFDYQRAQALAKKFDFRLKYLDLTTWYQCSPLLKMIPKHHPRRKIAKGNIKARLRMIALYHSTQLNNHIYLDTDDLSEELMGFWTKHGDEGDLKIIQNLTKTEVYDLAKFLGVPEIILNSKPSDGLKVTEKNLASEQLGLDYIVIEYLLSSFIEQGFDCNGSMEQLKEKRFLFLVQKLAKQIKQKEEKILQVLSQALKTAFKRKYGDNVANLLPERSELALAELGSREFNQLYLQALQASTLLSDTAQ
ncbi:MAG: NAD(+) synthase [Candidatus Woesebacteria bacterium]|jgi:NAD+ synthase